MKLNMDQVHPINNRTVKVVVSCCVVSKQVEVSTILVSVETSTVLATCWYLSVRQLTTQRTNTGQVPACSQGSVDSTDTNMIATSHAITKSVLQVEKVAIHKHNIA